MRQRIVALVLAVGLCLFSPVPPANAADGSLVIAALRVLEREYIDPVKPISLLNAAIASLRKSASLDEDALPEIPLDLPESTAVSKFNDEFKRATQAGKIPETDLAYAATKDMLRSLHDSHVWL